MVAPNNTEYAERTSEGGWRVTGTRVSLDSLVHAFWQGQLPEAIVADFPSLSLERVYGAIAFYLHNRADIDQYLLDQDRRWQAFQQESEARHGPLLKRIRAAARQPALGGMAGIDETNQ